MAVKRAIKLLLVSDFIIWTSFGLIGPVFAIFIEKSIEGGSIMTAGVASSIYLIVKAGLQIPCGKLLGRFGEKNTLLLGTSLITFVLLGYHFMTSATHLFIINAVYGFGAALAFPSWYSIFSRNLSMGREGYEWSVYEFFTNVGAGVSAFVGGFIAEVTGFRMLFLICFFFSLAGFFVLTLVSKRDLAEVFERSRKYRNVVGALVFKRGKLLVVKSRGRFALPGGDIFKSQLDSQALIENIQQDLENNVNVGSIIFFKDYKIKMPKDKKTMLVKTYICILDEPYFLPKKTVWLAKKDVSRSRLSSVLKVVLPDLISTNLLS